MPCGERFPGCPTHEPCGTSLPATIDRELAVDNPVFPIVLIFIACAAVITGTVAAANAYRRRHHVNHAPRPSSSRAQASGSGGDVSGITFLGLAGSDTPSHKGSGHSDNHSPSHDTGGGWGGDSGGGSDGGGGGGGE